MGSYPQPEWLVDREKLRSIIRRACARVRSGGSIPRTSRRRRTPPRWWRSATRSGPGSTSSPTARCGARATRTTSSARSRGSTSTTPARCPTATATRCRCRGCTGAIQRRGPVQVRDVEFLRANTDRLTKVTVPGPFTMAAQAQNEFYEHPRDVAFAFADAVREEVIELFAAGADIVQLDEPWMESRHELAREFGLETLHRALDGVEGTKALHICFGYPLFVPGPSARLPLPGRARRRAGRSDLDRVGAGQARSQRPRAAPEQDDHPRRDRARRPRGRDARDRGGAAAASAAVPPGSHRGAGLRDEVPPAGVRVRQASGAKTRGRPA